MSIMIDLPPAIEQEAKGYVMLDGMTLEQVVLSCYVISSQVLSEFVNTALNKLKKSDEEVVGHLRQLKTMRVVPVSAEWLERAVEIRSRYDLQVLDKDIFTIPIKEIGSIDPVCTYFDGQEMHFPSPVKK